MFPPSIDIYTKPGIIFPVLSRVVSTIFDRRAEPRAVEIGADEGGAGFTRRVVLGECCEDGGMVERHEDVARRRILQPGARGLDPHDARILQRGVAAGGLYQRGVAADFCREGAEAVEFYHWKESIT